MSSSRIRLCWCHQCQCSVRIERGMRMVCPLCEDGFIEEMENPNNPFSHPHPHPHHHHHHHHYSPFSAMRWGGRRWMRRAPPPPPPPSAVHMDMMEAVNAFMNGMDMERGGGGGGGGGARIFRSDHSLAPDPVVVVRGLAHGLMDEEGGVEVIFDNPPHHHFHRHRHRHHHHHHHHHGHMGDYALDHLIQQLAAGVSGNSAGGGGDQCGPPPAARSAVEAMPTVKITAKHLTVESNCAVCTDPFEIGGEVKEMPCKHIYHADCILPWLAEHNSCPVCRHEMPTDDVEYDSGRREGAEGQAPGRMGLTIWGLPGGGFAVGRFANNSRNNSSSSSSPSSSSSSIFGRGGFVSDLGIRNSNRENHGRRNFLSSLWPFRSSNSQPSSSSSASNNGSHSRWWFI